MRIADKLVEREIGRDLRPVSREKMIPHHVQRDRGYAAGFRAEPVARFTDFRQVIGEYIHAPVHVNSRHDIRRVKRVRFAAHKVRHQVAGQRTLRKMREVQMGEKIHNDPFQKER